MLPKRELGMINWYKPFAQLEVLFSLELKQKVSNIMMTRVNTQVCMPREDLQQLTLVREIFQTFPNSVIVQMPT